MGMTTTQPTETEMAEFAAQDEARRAKCARIAARNQACLRFSHGESLSAQQDRAEREDGR
jgi:hypothetical protein